MARRIGRKGEWPIRAGRLASRRGNLDREGTGNPVISLEFRGLSVVVRALGTGDDKPGETEPRPAIGSHPHFIRPLNGEQGSVANDDRPTIQDGTLFQFPALCQFGFGVCHGCVGRAWDRSRSRHRTPAPMTKNNLHGARLMNITRDCATCPRCGSRVPLATPSRLRARRLGVSCVCSACGWEWIHRTDAKRPESVGRVSPERETLFRQMRNSRDECCP